MTIARRLQCIEYQQVRREFVDAGASAGISGDALFAEARRVFSLTDAEQRAYFCRLYAELSPQEAAELDAIRHRWTVILRGGR
jgi:hypothetical protein